ncbi:uncharacterized protein LAJ45_04856 [Morchella importuna]|uniref:uncharacterized protein n=1 Tax=Morchella importuna TaxID=1174673 RepID=UPI001E8DC22C|nr:uncharacterized protein LAJ45_04856 [Morchella importuna]KAH8151154.1 hypothetical protein LAJ45_04856 [Morchella importuna]
MVDAQVECAVGEGVECGKVDRCNLEILVLDLAATRHPCLSACARSSAADLKGLQGRQGLCEVNNHNHNHKKGKKKKKKRVNTKRTTPFHHETAALLAAQPTSQPFWRTESLLSSTPSFRDLLRWKHSLHNEVMASWVRSKQQKHMYREILCPDAALTTRHGSHALNQG